MQLTSKLRYVRVAFSSTFCVSPTARPICVAILVKLLIISSTNQQIGKQYWHHYDKYHPQYAGHSKVIQISRIIRCYYCIISCKLSVIWKSSKPKNSPIV